MTEVGGEDTGGVECDDLWLVRLSDVIPLHVEPCDSCKAVGGPGALCGTHAAALGCECAKVGGAKLRPPHWQCIRCGRTVPAKARRMGSVP